MTYQIRFAAVALVLGIASLVSNEASAGLTFCNDTPQQVHFAVGFKVGEWRTEKDGEWRSRGWFIISPGECMTPIGGDLKHRYYYFYAERLDGYFLAASENQNGGYFCISEDTFDIGDVPCQDQYPEQQFRIIDTGEDVDYTYEFTCSGCWSSPTDDQEYLLDSETDVVEDEIETGVVEERCLFRWDADHQLHAEKIIVKWGYQSAKTTMKRLHHCIKLEVIGPIDVGGVARSYVNECVQHGLKNEATRYIVQGLLSIGADVLATGGGATAATLADYIDSVVSNTIDCLMDADRIESYLSDVLREKFQATVFKESQWIYWDV